MRQSLNKEDKKRIGNEIRAHLQDNAIRNTQLGENKYLSSAKELAWKTNLANTTIFKLHSGEFSMKTLRLVEAVLESKFNINAADNRDIRNTEPVTNSTTTNLGGYSKELIEPYIGRFLTARRGATVPSNILCTIVDIKWDEDIMGARFYETNKFKSSYGKEMDYSQAGTVHISPQIGMIHLLTSFKGALRLVTLTKMQLIEPVMYGAILTQVPEAGHYIPIKSTVHFRKMDDENSDELSSLVGPIPPEHSHHGRLSIDLEEAENAILVR